MFSDFKIQLYININDILKSRQKNATVKGDSLYFDNNIMTVTENKNNITMSLTNKPSGITVKQVTTWFELERNLDTIIGVLLLDLSSQIELLRNDTLEGINKSILGMYNIPKKDIEKINDYAIKFYIEEDFSMTYEVREEFVRSSVYTKNLNNLIIDTPIGKFVPQYLVGYIIQTMQSFYNNTR